VRGSKRAIRHAVQPTTITISTVGKQNNNDKAKLPSSRIFQVYIAPLSPSFPPGEQKSTMRRGIYTHVSMRGRTTASALTLSGSFTQIVLYLHHACFILSRFAFRHLGQSTEVSLREYSIPRFTLIDELSLLSALRRASQSVSSPRDSRGLSASTTASSYANHDERNSTHTGADVSLHARLRSFFDGALSLFIEQDAVRSALTVHKLPN
jgi:hypothetical protein